MNKQEELRKEYNKEYSKYKKKGFVSRRPYVSLEVAQKQIRNVVGFRDNGTIKCRVNLPACYINKKVRIIVVK